MIEALSVDGITTRYGKRIVIQEISLRVEVGEIFGLIGLNGVGKTTLIKTILDLVTPAAGTVRIFDEDNRLPASRSKLSYLPENFRPSPLLTGIEFLRFNLSYCGVPLDRDRSENLARGLGFDPAALNRRIGTYSMGMGQQLGLMGMLMTDMPLLILDEPMTGLDPRARIRLKQQLSQHRAAGNTMFFSSHILSDVEELCDRIGIVHMGRLAYLGTPEELKQQHGATSLEKAFLVAIEQTELAG